MAEKKAPTSPIVKKAAEQKAEAVPKSKGAALKVLLGAGEGLPNFYLREFTLEPGARIPEHRHDSIEHVQLVLEGEMTLSLDGKVHVVGEGDSIYIPPDVAHWYENRTKSRVRFLCAIPAVKDYATEWTRV